MFRSTIKSKPSHLTYTNQNTYTEIYPIGYNRETKEYANTIVFDIHMIKNHHIGLKFILELFGDFYWEFNDGMARYLITVEYRVNKLSYVMAECIYNGFKNRAPFIFSFEDIGNGVVRLKITHVLCLLRPQGYYANITYNFISYWNKSFDCEGIKYVETYNEEHVETLQNKLNPDIGESTRYEHSKESNMKYATYNLLETANDILVSSFLDNLTDKYSVRIFKGYDGIRILYNTSTNDKLSEIAQITYEDSTKVFWFGNDNFKQEQPMTAKLVITNERLDSYNYPSELSTIRYSTEVSMIYDGEDDFYYYFHFKNFQNTNPSAISDDTVVIIGLKISEYKNIIKPSTQIANASLIPEKKLQNNLQNKQNNSYKIYKLCYSKHNFYSSFLYKLRGVDKCVYNVA